MHRRFNPTAAVALAAVALAVAAAALTLRLVRPGMVRAAATAQVDRLLDAGRADLAMRHLGRYVATHPEDLAMRRLQARLVAEQALETEQARAIDVLRAAITLNSRLLALEPEGSARDDVRARLARLYIRYSDAYYAGLARRGAQRMAVPELRYQTALELADQLVEHRPDDPEARLLRAMALEGLAVPGNRAALTGAIDGYEQVLKLTDGDEGDDGRDMIIIAAERLARLYRDPERRNDPAAAAQVLDRLVATLPDDVDARLARYRFYREGQTAADEARAAEELRAALELQPGNARVRLAAAEFALQRGDTAAARDYLDALAAPAPGDDGGAAAEDLRLLVMRGLVSFQEEHPQEAMDQWRQGLVLVHGSHADLSWWLAYVLIRLGRVYEAQPLIEQYGRLAADKDDPAIGLLWALRDEQLGNPKSAAELLEGLLHELKDGPLRLEMVMALGRCYEAIGDDERAFTEYRRAAREAPGSPTPRLAMARLRLGDRAGAAATILEEAIRSGNADPELLLALAKVRLREQAARPPGRRAWAEFDEALAEVERRRPADTAVALLRADRAALDGHPDQADAVLREALARVPRAAPLWTARAELMIRQGRPGEARQLLEEGLRQVGEDATLRLAEARVLVALGRGREAQRRLLEGAEAVRATDQKAALYEALGRLRDAQGDVEGARVAFEAWAAAAPGSPAPVSALLELALRTGRAEEASERLAKLRTLGGEDGEEDLSYRLARAATLVHLAGRDGRPEAPRLVEAGKILDDLLRDAPEHEGAYLLRGRVRERQGRPEEAVEDYRKAWARGAEAALPPLVDLLAGLGRYDEIEQLRGPQADPALEQISAQALLGVGERDRAAQLLDRLVADPARADAWRTRLLELAGRTDAVEAMLREAARRDGGTSYEPWAELVAFLDRQGRPAEQIDAAIAEALAALPADDAELLEARLRLAAGDLGGADAAIEAALARAPDDLDTLLDAASYFETSGRPARAEGLLERALELAAGDRRAALELALLLSGHPDEPGAWEQALELAGPGGDAETPQDRLARAVVLSRAPDPARHPEAVALLEGLLADLPIASPIAVAARDYLVRLLLRDGRAERAAEVASVSASGPAADPEAVALAVEALIAADRLLDAELELDRLALYQPGDPVEASLRAELIVRRAGPDEAPTALADAVAARGNSPGAAALARAACERLLEDGRPEALKVADRLAGELADRRPAAAWLLGLVRARQGRPDEAIDLGRGALEADGAGLEELIGVGRAALAVARAVDADGDLAGDADALVDAALERRPGDADLLSYAALIAHHRGDYRREADLYREILRQRPGDEMALYNLALVCSEGLGQPKEGLEAIDRLLAQAGPFASILGARGVILTRLGRLDEAIGDLERSVALEPSAPRHYYLARAYRRAGRDEAFRAQLELARRAGLSLEAAEPWQREEMRELLGGGS